MKTLLVVLGLSISAFAADAGHPKDAGAAPLTGVRVHADAGAPEADAGTVASVAPVTDAGAVVDAGTEAADAGVVLLVSETVHRTGLVTQMNETGRMSGWALIGLALLVTLLTWGIRRLGGAVLPSLKTDRGGALTVLASGVVCGVVIAFLAGDGAPLLRGLDTGFLAACVSAGGFTIVKRLLFPADPAAPTPTPAPTKPS